MAYVTINVIDTNGARQEKLDDQKNYKAFANDDGYGIIVIEDSLRQGRQYGTFKDGQLTLLMDENGIIVRYANQTKMEHTQSKSVYLKPTKGANLTQGVDVINPSQQPSPRR